jgi:hypothetical protein
MHWPSVQCSDTRELPITGAVGSTEGTYLMIMDQIKRAAIGAGAASLAALALAAPASAAASTASCAGATSQPFLPWGDANLYTLAPGGDLESASGWTLSRGAALVKGSEPFKATGKLGAYSLSLPTGAVAVSPPVCLTINHPTFRFFEKATQGNSASLRAEALADSPTQVVGLGAVNGTTAWAPAAPLSTGASDLLLGATGSISVRLRFTADYGSWQIDDVFVDPRKMG